MGGEEQPQVLLETDNSKRKLDDIQLAKQKAQEFVARLVSDAETKRPRLNEDSSNSFIPPTLPEVAPKLPSQLTENSQGGLAPFAAQPGSNYGFQGTSKRIDIPNGKVGVIIGKAGETIKYLQLQSGARIQVTKDAESDPYSQTRDVELMGTPEQISRAEQLIKDVIAETDAGGSGSSAVRGYNPVPHGAEQLVMTVPNNKVALIIGKGGENIKNMQRTSGARIQVIPLHLPPGDTSTERNVYINGTKEQIESAKELVNEVISENRVRNPSAGSGYVQQGYQPPGNWAPPGPPSMPQPGYGYTQPGTYPTPPPPYYGSYPPQPAGWDQSNPSATPPQPSTGYNYYGEQGQTGSAQTNINYGYSQTPTSSQNYDQDYSQQPQTYGQDTTPQFSQHDQQKPYVTPGYGPPAGSSQLGGTAPTQPYGAQSSTQPPPTYQVTYSQPPAVPPTAYGPSQSYTGPPPPQLGYDQTGYTQSGYGGQSPAQLPPPAQTIPPSQQVYGQGGYPPQPVPPTQPSYIQGAAIYGQPQPQVQPSPTMYSVPVAYSAERNGDRTSSNIAASATQEAVHPQT